MILPDNLADWTLETVQRLIASGRDENDRFDFKVDLSSSLPKSACAFANTRGGFLIFGVSDHPRELQGVETHEFMSRFGHQIHGKIEPSIDDNFECKILEISENKSLVVVHIPQSRRGPHSIEIKSKVVFPKSIKLTPLPEVLEETWTAFYKRVASGSCISMSYEEIRMAFQDQNRRQNALRLLDNELGMIEKSARHLATEADRPLIYGQTPIALRLVRYSVDGIQVAMLDVLNLLSHDQGAWNILMSMKYAMSMHNTYASSLDAKWPMDRAQFMDSMEHYRDGIWKNAKIVEAAVKQLRTILELHLATAPP